MRRASSLCGINYHISHQGPTKEDEFYLLSWAINDSFTAVLHSDGGYVHLPATRDPLFGKMFPDFLAMLSQIFSPTPTTELTINIHVLIIEISEMHRYILDQMPK